MKIDSIKTYLVDSGSAKHWLFVKIETNEGIHGWGEAYTQLDRDRVIERQIDELSRYLVGCSLSTSSSFFSLPIPTLPASVGAWSYSAPSAVWNRRYGTLSAKPPVSQYTTYWAVGTRRRLRVYANGWGGAQPPDELADRARAVVDRGFTALKFDPFPGPWRAYIDRHEEEEAVDRVRPCGRRLDQTWTFWSRCIAGWLRCMLYGWLAPWNHTPRSGSRSRSPPVTWERWQKCVMQLTCR